MRRKEKSAEKARNNTFERDGFKENSNPSWGIQCLVKQLTKVIKLKLSLMSYDFWRNMSIWYCIRYQYHYVKYHYIVKCCGYSQDTIIF